MLILLFFCSTLQFGIRTSQEGVYISFLTTAKTKNGEYFAVGSNKEGALDFTSLSNHLVLINDGKKKLNVTENGMLVVQPTKMGKEKKIFRQIFSSDRFVVLFDKKCLTYLSIPNAFKFMACGNNEHQMFEGVHLDKIDNTGVHEGRFEYGAIKDGNSNMSILDIVKEAPVNTVVEVSEQPPALEVKPIIEVVDLSQRNLPNEIKVVAPEKEEVFVPLEEPRGNSKPLLDDFDHKDVLHPFGSKCGGKASVKHDRIPSVDEYYAKKYNVLKSKHSNILTKLDKNHNSSADLFIRRTGDRILSTSSKGHRGLREIKPSFDMDYNRETPKHVTSTY
ncbi:hypothetical protein NGRA_1330 [Nosema granulosis]|uniref:Uncharacterized protein n=1 Tax=Nosema granulosis TaxID=83296 RepID=A0A9P6KYQ5_9MICR|nr:hypothetical protein NGRA_1330 [Nosema granulosis]